MPAVVPVALSKSWRLLPGMLVLGLTACVSLPPAPLAEPSHALADTGATRLGQASQALRSQTPGFSTFTPLAEGGMALGARLGLIELAERSLDLQYYIWRSDESGERVLARLCAAAARGVRVRLLLDDIGNAVADATLAGFAALPNFEVRLFNPVALRASRTLGALFDFARLNRRMHNKSLIADNQVAILGGRNIGDEYFAARGEADFGDLDVLALGPLVPQASAAFDAYWNSSHAWPVGALAGAAVAAAAPRAEAAAVEAALIPALLGSPANFFAAPATLLVDAPDKISRAPDDPDGHLWPQLLPLIEATQQELLLISPYFVPGAAGMAFLRALRARGVAVTVLTNSLAATDVSAVHAGYAPYRQALLAAGIELWEVKPGVAPASQEDDRRRRPLIGDSLRSSLHAKTFVFDRREIFIGSLNLDPRSTALNTESGVLIGNPELAARLSRNIRRLLPASAYQLSLHAGRLRWSELLPDGSVRDYTSEPQTSVLRRLWVDFLGLLPIEEQL